VSALGSPRVHLRLTDSTNERARELAIAGAPHGTLVTAAEQSAGRGRQGRRWTAPRGQAILMSLVLRPVPRLLPLMAAIGVCDVVGEQARIKWPNDVVVAASAKPGLAKVAGILAEGRPGEGWAVLGIGLNVAVRLRDLPAELRGQGPSGALPAATMSRPGDELEPTLELLLAALETRLSASANSTLTHWRERDALLGKEIAWSGGHGRAEGIDGDGRLIVLLPQGGQTALSAGEVHLESVA